MKKEIYFCDIFGEEIGAQRTREGKGGQKVQVIFTIEQNEGRAIRPDVWRKSRKPSASQKSANATGKSQISGRSTRGSRCGRAREA
jgi:hypothetical protein